jgi:hypothetical protein
LAAVAFATAAVTQCDPQWLPGHGPAGVGGNVAATIVWDEDGSGAIPPRLIVGGFFESAGTAKARNLAALDLQTNAWSKLGGGANQPVGAFAIDAAGALVVAGGFTQLGGVAMGAIARWANGAWQALGSGIVGAVNTVTVLPNGDLVAGGSFSTAGGIACANIARWNGSVWSPLGTGCNQPVNDLQLMPNGDLVATGHFTNAGGVAANRIARWDGTSWSALGSGLTGSMQFGIDVSYGIDLAIDAQGQLLVGGSFFAAGGVAASWLARWNGTTWQSVGWNAGIVGKVWVRASGETWVAGAFNGGLRRWVGSAWSITGIGFGSEAAIRSFAEMPSGDLCVGGWFSLAGGSVANGVARWNGSTWSAFTPGIVGQLFCGTRLSNGDLVVGGDVTGMPGAQVNRIARWNGTAWAGVGAGNNNIVRALLALPDGSFVAGAAGSLGGTTATGTPARWTGTAWQTLGGGAMGPVLALARTANGDIIAGGSFDVIGAVQARGLARWNGTAWQAFAPLLAYGSNPPIVNDIAVLPNGDLIVGGLFTSAGSMPVSHVARWDGSNWHAFPPLSFGYVLCVQALRDGNFAIGGDIQIGNIRKAARWDGSAWQALGPAVTGDSGVYAIAELPNGDFVVGGDAWLVNGQWSRAMRTDGASWMSLPGGVNSQSSNGQVRDFLWSEAGELILVGGFEYVGNSVSRCLARLATPCPAQSTAVPTPCVGPAGPMILATTTQPWTGAALHSTCSGFAVDSIAASVFSFGLANLNLATAHPTGLAGCVLMPSPDVVVISIPQNGIARGECRLANSPIWAGTLIHHQFVQGQFDPAFELLSLSSSNALTFTVGAF